MKKSITDYINEFKETDLYEYIQDLKKSDRYIRIKESKIFSCVNKLKRGKYFTTPMIIFACLGALLLTFNIEKYKDSNNVIGQTIAENIAEQDFYNNKYDEAIKEYTKYQEKDTWPIWNLKIAEIYSVNGDFTKSNDILTKVYLERNKIVDTKKQNEIENFEDKDKELTNYIVFTALMNGDYEKALQYGELFLSDYPSDKKLLNTMFIVYEVNGQKDKMKEIINNYAKEDQTASDLANLARMNIILENYDEGISLLKDAFDKDYNEPKIIDVITETANKNSTILDKLTELEKKDKENIANKIFLSAIYSQNKDTVDKANELINEIESKNQNIQSINLSIIKANLYTNMGDEEKAKNIINNLLEDNKYSYIGYYLLAGQEYDDGNYDEAYKNCEKSIILNKDYPESYGLLMPEILKNQDNSNIAESYFRTALYKDPCNYNILVKAAEYYGNTIGDTSKAMHYYELANKINPKDGDIYYYMALIQNSNERKDDAIDLLKKSISLNNKDVRYHRALGTVYLNKGQGENAIKEIKTAYSIDKNDILTLNNAGCYYAQIEGDINRAFINLKAAYEGINENTSEEDKNIITTNYNRVKNLSDVANNRSGSSLKIQDLKLFY